MSGMGNAARAKPARERRSAVRAGEVIVGSDILELVSNAMYVDSMSLFREYVQNAADAVDAARSAGTLGVDEPGRVAIDIDAKTRSVRIRDNGCGLDGEAFVSRLAALGGSTKRGTDARGFRGVGRLAGLGYAQTLTFRSRVRADEPVSELIWDGRALKALMVAGDRRGDVRDLIEAVVQVGERQDDEAPDRFFEVELCGLVRLRGDPLLNGAAIADYLGQVAPVPFSPDFSWGPVIVERLSRHVALSPLEITVSGHSGLVYRPHRDEVLNGNKAPLTIRDVGFLEIPDVDGEVGAVGWILHHDYEGALANATLQKGFRLRSGNIQIGGDALLENEFPETRFNSWTIGEAHVLDRRVVPNGRRDHFEQNAHFSNLVNHLVPSFRDIAHRCRTSSTERKRQRDLELILQATETGIEQLRQNSVGEAARAKLVSALKDQVEHAKKLAGAGSDDGKAVIETRMGSAEAALENVMRATDHDPLAHLEPAERAQYQHFFELIYDCSQNRVVAKALIDRIIARIST